MFLSVIIPTRNRSILLKRTLDSLIIQDLPQDNFEVIVIDNGSKDGTSDICREYKKRFLNFKFIYILTPGLHVGRHLGLKNSKGDVLVYADDDIRAFSSWLIGVVESFTKYKADIVGGKTLPEFESIPPPWIDQLYRKTPYGNILGSYSLIDFGNVIKEISPIYIWGCNFSIKKSILLEAKGFHPDGMPWDLIEFRGDGETHVGRFILKKGYKAIYNPKASIYHYISKKRLTLDYIYQRSYAQGISDSYTEIRNNYDLSIKPNFMTILKKIKDDFKYQVKYNMQTDPLNKMLMRAHRDGWNFHQNAIKNSPGLLEWVLKDNYFNDESSTWLQKELIRREKTGNVK